MSPKQPNAKRLAYKRNLLFEKWIKQAMESTFARESKSYYAYKKALSSLQKYPLVLGSAKECRILEGFGTKLCDFLEEKLVKYAEELGFDCSEALKYGNDELASIAQNRAQRSAASNAAVSAPVPQICNRISPVKANHPIPVSRSPVKANHPIPVSRSVSFDSQPSNSSEPADIEIDYPLKFFYIDQDGKPVETKDRAHSTYFDSDSCKGYRIRCSYVDLITAGIPYRIDWTATGLGGLDSSSTLAYLLDSDAPHYSTNSVAIVTGQTNAVATEQESRLHPNSVIPVSLNSKEQEVSGRALPLKRSHSDALPLPSIHAATPYSRNGPCRSQPPSPVPPRSDISDRLSTPVTIPHNQYDLVLLSDLRENFGAKHVRQLLAPKLESYGIACESRALPVGDFLWIARWTSHQGEWKEAVLDYIIERKRMDDLASSIVDGRFQEQKYRMKRTGISNSFYLFEECPSMRNQRISYETLIQSVSNGQVIDGFRVLTSRCPDDTVDLLVTFSVTLQKNYQKADLRVLPHTQFVSAEPRDGPSLIGLDWTEFVQLASKSPPPTIRDMFAKQLLQIHGLSGPKVAAILNAYPTPLSLFRAYDAQSTSTAKENMLTSLRITDSQRSLGSTLSRRVYQAYNTK